jgi:hypothetical protein
MRGTILFGALLATLAPGPVHAQDWRVHVGTGIAYNLPLPLVIEQEGAPALSLDAEFETRPFETPLYYVVRLERANAGGAFALELVHHKIFLANPPPEVDEFAISHGFNVVTLQRAWAPSESVSWRAGAGVVVAHPETAVRGRRQPKGGWLDRGYYVSGPATQLGAGLARPLTGRLRVAVESKLIAARAWVPIAGGSARLWHLSGHLAAVLDIDL